MRHAVNTLGRMGIVCLFWLLVSLAGCTTNSPHRFNLIDSTEAQQFEHGADACRQATAARAGRKPGNATDDATRFDVPFQEDRHPCYAHSVERNSLYTLFFIELDEQGRFYNPRQIEALINHLQVRQDGRGLTRREGCRGGDGTGAGISLVTFVHGWRHNARYDDDNVELARAVLAQTQQGERHGAQYNPEMCPREVVGVYVGWRGLSLTAEAAPWPLKRLLAPLLELPTVWDRKNTAQNVAVGSVRELFSLLRTYQDRRNRAEQEHCALALSSGRMLAQDVYQCKAVRHLIVGHSFGALIVHNAISQQLIESIASGHFLPEGSNMATACEPNGNGSDTGKALVRGYADLVVLLNPAVEGARFEPLHEAVQRRQSRLKQGVTREFCAGQMPVYVTITTRYDDATRHGFNLVRFFATLFESNTPYDVNLTPVERRYIAEEERISSARALGHVRRYHTHELRAWDDFRDRVLQPATDSPAPGPLATGVALVIDRYCQGEAADSRKPGCEGPQVRSAAFYRREFGSDGNLVFRLGDGDATPGQAADPQAVDVARIDAAESRRQSALAVAKSGQPAPVLTKDDVDDDVQSCRKAAQTDLWLSAGLLARNGPEGTPGNGWALHALGGSVLSHVSVYESALGRENHAPSAPLWNVYVQDSAIMGGHNAIEGRALIQLIAQLYRAVVVKSHDPDVLEGLAKVAHCELDKCNLLPSERQKPCDR